MKRWVVIVSGERASLVDELQSRAREALTHVLEEIVGAIAA